MLCTWPQPVMDVPMMCICASVLWSGTFFTTRPQPLAKRKTSVYVCLWVFVCLCVCMHIAIHLGSFRQSQMYLNGISDTFFSVKKNIFYSNWLPRGVRCYPVSCNTFNENSLPFNITINHNNFVQTGSCTSNMHKCHRQRTKQMTSVNRSAAQLLFCFSTEATWRGRTVKVWAQSWRHSDKSSNNLIKHFSLQSRAFTSCCQACILDWFTLIR